MRRLIVGVDPGVTVGLAALSLNGVPVFVDSKRGWAFPDLIRAVSELGEPTIISSDVVPASEILERLSVSLNAVLFVPLISMGGEEKHQTAKDYVEGYGLKLKNAHEVDALAAAVKAYQHYRNKFEQVEARVNREGLKVSADDVKDLVVRGCTLKRAIHLLLRSGEKQASAVLRPIVPREEKMKTMIEELTERLTLEKERFKRLRATNEELRIRIKELKVEVSGLKERIGEIRGTQLAQIRREREYQRLEDEAGKLRGKLSACHGQLEDYRRRFDQMQRLRQLESQGRLVLLKPVEAFTENGLRRAFTLYNIKAGDSVLLLDPSGGGAATAETLAKRGVRTVVSKGSMAHQAQEVLTRYMTPVIPSKILEIEWIEGFPYVDAESLRKALKEAGKIEVARAFEEVKTILEDHRKEIEEG